MFDVVNIFFCIKFRLCKCFAGEIILKKYNIEKKMMLVRLQQDILKKDSRIF